MCVMCFFMAYCLLCCTYITIRKVLMTFSRSRKFLWQRGRKLQILKPWSYVKRHRSSAHSVRLYGYVALYNTRSGKSCEQKKICDFSENLALFLKISSRFERWNATKINYDHRRHGCSRRSCRLYIGKPSCRQERRAPLQPIQFLLQYWSSRSSEVNNCYLIWKSVCHFLLVIYSNLGPISRRFRDMASSLLKRTFFPTLSIQPHIWKCFPCTISPNFVRRKHREKAN